MDSAASELARTLPNRGAIVALQNALLPIRDDCPEAEHFFAPKMYGRRFTMPAGMLVVGKIHRHAHLMMVLKGRAIVVTEFGRDEVSAGYVTVSQPGAKRVVLALEETVFMTVHYNESDSRDMAEIELEHIEDEGFLSTYHRSIEGGLQ